MDDGVIIDANIIPQFLPQYVKQEGNIYDLFNDILSKYGIAICKQIQREWLNTCNHPIIEAWLTDNLKNGNIRHVKPKLHRDIKKKLRTDYGLPRGSPDIHLISCANVTEVRYIISEDMDLFDPKMKRAKSKTRTRIKQKRTGNLCRYLHKQLKIRVGLLHHCRVDLFTC